MDRNIYWKLRQRRSQSESGNHHSQKRPDDLQKQYGDSSIQYIKHYGNGGTSYSTMFNQDKGLFVEFTLKKI